MVPGLPAYSLPSIVEGEFPNVAKRFAFFDGRLSEVNRLVTSLTQSIGEQNSAAFSRASTVEQITFDLQSEINTLHTQSSDQLDHIAELELQLKEQDLLIKKMDVLHQQLSVRFETHLKDFQHFIAEHFLPIQRHVALHARCTCFNDGNFVQSPIDDVLSQLLNTIIQQGVDSQAQVPIPIPDPSTRRSRVETFTLTPFRPRSPTPSSFRRVFIRPSSSTNPPSPDTDQSLRSSSVPTPFLMADKGSGSDLPPLEPCERDSDGSMAGSSDSGEEIREGFSRSGIRAGSL